MREHDLIEPHTGLPPPTSATWQHRSLDRSSAHDAVLDLLRIVVVDLGRSDATAPPKELCAECSETFPVGSIKRVL